jgi:spore germination protein GerM
MKRLHWLFVIAAMIMAVGLVTGCGSSSPGATPSATETTSTPATSEPPQTTPSPTPTATSSPSPTSTKTLTVALYFLRGEDVGVAHRTIPYTVATGSAAMKLLVEGPNAEEKAAGLGSTIPAGTKFLGLDIKDGIATVDLSSTYASGGGSLSMFTRLAEVVYTLTQFPTVKGVEFKLDGEKVTVFSSEGIGLDHPQTRADYEDQTPAILVEDPAVGDAVSSPMRLKGTANVFEATFQMKLVDANGKVLAKGTVQATSGTGTRGTFSTPVLFAPTTSTGKLVVYEVSMKDGSAINVVKIPLAFE